MWLVATILDSTALDIDLVKTADRLTEVYSLVFLTKVQEGVSPFRGPLNSLFRTLWEDTDSLKGSEHYHNDITAFIAHLPYDSTLSIITLFKSHDKPEE